MDQNQRRRYLLDQLLAEQPRYSEIPVPDGEQPQKDLLRSLMNVRLPAPISEEFLRIQDEYLQQAFAEKGVTDLADLTPVSGDLYLWQGDITLLKVDAIVNAANSGMLGCFHPLHNCIDNCIHTYAGIQLRAHCARLMEAQGEDEPTGQAKITPAYNLPSKYVLHTVGPIVQGPLKDLHRRQLASCYRSCLALAAESHCESVAFCCISTGVFGFPQNEAAQIAVDTVRTWKTQTGSPMKVVFNVFKDEDLHLYQALL